MSTSQVDIFLFTAFCTDIVVYSNCIHTQCMDNKTTVINVRSSKKFKKDLEAYADSIGLDMSACIRMTMLKKMKESK